ncbi:hypothetical protein FDECE_11862 [Fusarium decemcellulare]|nr:hypothetical protein FDECE_11862 [Fusarium decemcellulare]
MSGHELPCPTRTYPQRQRPSTLTSKNNRIKDGVLITEMNDDSLKVLRRGDNFTIANYGQLGIAYHQAENGAENAFFSSDGPLKTVAEIRSLQAGNMPNSPSAVPNVETTFSNRSNRSNHEREQNSCSNTTTDTKTCDQTRSNIDPVVANPVPTWRALQKKCTQAVESVKQIQRRLHGQLDPLTPDIRPILLDLEVQMVICESPLDILHEFYVSETEHASLSEIEELLKNSIEKLRVSKQQLQKLSQALQNITRDGRSKAFIIALLLGLSWRSDDDDCTKTCLEFHDQLQSVTQTLYEFQRNCSRLENIQSPQKREPLSEAEKEVLDRFATCRKVSAILYHQLRQVCPFHPEHRVYFNLKVNEMRHQRMPELHFDLAFEATNMYPSDATLIWFRAKSSLITLTADGVSEVHRKTMNRAKSRADPYRISKRAGGNMTRSNKPQTRSSPTPGITASMFSPGQLGFCLGDLRQQTGKLAVDLPDMMVAGNLTVGRNILCYPDKLSPDHHNPIRLSQWIEGGYNLSITPGENLSQDLMRVKIARLLCEAVLRFTPTLWPQHSLSSSHVLVLDPSARGNFEPHLSVRLEKTKHPETDPTRPPCSSPSQEIFLRLGIILLEIAYLRVIQGLRQNDAGEIDREDFSFNEVKNLCGTNLHEQFGRSEYAKAVEYCINFSGPETGIQSRELQEQFYQVVVVGLEKIEKRITKSLQWQERFKERI